jgi:hypothetical protein
MPNRWPGEMSRENWTSSSHVESGKHHVSSVHFRHCWSTNGEGAEVESGLAAGVMPSLGRKGLPALGGSGPLFLRRA